MLNTHNSTGLNHFTHWNTMYTSCIFVCVCSLTDRLTAVWRAACCGCWTTLALRSGGDWWGSGWASPSQTPSEYGITFWHLMKHDYRCSLSLSVLFTILTPGVRHRSMVKAALTVLSCYIVEMGMILLFKICKCSHYQRSKEWGLEMTHIDIHLIFGWREASIFDFQALPSTTVEHSEQSRE